MADRKLDLFELLGKIHTKNAQYYDTLTEDQLKEYAPLVVTRWLTGTTQGGQIYLINEFVNPYIFALQRHKKLLYLLQCACATGKTTRNSWVKAPSKKAGSSKPVSVSVIQRYFDYSSNDARCAVDSLCCDDIIEMAHECGCQSDDIAKIKKEFKT